MIDFDSICNISNELEKTISKYASQWDVLCADANDIRINISDNMNGFELLEELMQRIENTKDPLNGLEKYRPIFNLGGGPAHLVYAKAYELVWNKDENRSAKLFKFLINDNNPNGFTVGNSHYWYARHLYFVKKDSKNALNHYLQVHKYPSCLVFTDAAYCRAAGIYNEIGKPDIALALYSVQIPHIDHWRREMLKAERSFKIAIEQNDYSNAIYQIERKNRAIAFTGITNQFNSLRWERKIKNIIYKKMKNEALVRLNLKQPFIQPSKRNARKRYRNIIKHVATFASPDSYEINCIRKALDGPEKGHKHPSLKEMLLHAWPMIEDVDPVILTNRVLSNNIFKHKKRKL